MLGDPNDKESGGRKVITSNNNTNKTMEETSGTWGGRITCDSSICGFRIYSLTLIMSPLLIEHLDIVT
jgi:hypothetical protein